MYRSIVTINCSIFPWNKYLNEYYGIWAFLKFGAQTKYSYRHFLIWACVLANSSLGSTIWLLICSSLFHHYLDQLSPSIHYLCFWRIQRQETPRARISVIEMNVARSMEIIHESDFSTPMNHAIMMTFFKVYLIFVLSLMQNINGIKRRNIGIEP